VPSSPLAVETENGAIRVAAGGEGTEVTVVARLRAYTEERLAATRVVAERVEDDTLAVRVEWPEGGREDNEGCSFDITLPDVRGVRLKTSNGTLSLAGATGSAGLETSNGGVTVRGHDGDVDITTSNGAVTAEGLTGAAAIGTSNGSIKLGLAPAGAGPVSLRTSNGAVRLDVGSAFAGELSIETSNGSIRVPRGGPGVEVRQHDDGSAKLSFGARGKPSRIRTSNGSVTVTRRG
jgi:DUF4097 and DUF4098 domain-containing protein YvlB